MPSLTVELPEQLIEEIAQRAARLLRDELQPAPEEPEQRYLTPADAAAYLGVRRKRVYDLTSAGVLVPDGRDGRTPLYTRETIDAYVLGRDGEAAGCDLTCSPVRANVEPSSPTRVGGRRSSGPARGRRPIGDRHAG